MGKQRKGTHGESIASPKHSSLPNDLSNLQDMLQDSSVLSGWMNKHHFSGRATREWEPTGIEKAFLEIIDFSGPPLF